MVTVFGLPINLHRSRWPTRNGLNSFLPTYWYVYNNRSIKRPAILSAPIQNLNFRVVKFVFQTLI